jgi:hypothetical protein
LLLAGEWGSYSVLDDNVGLTMDKAVPSYFKFVVGFGKHCIGLGIQPVAEQLPIVVKNTGMFTNVSDVLYPVSAFDSAPIHHTVLFDLTTAAGSSRRAAF